jgi:hypothetical protein
VRDDVWAHRPLLYQVNTRVLLGERGRALGRPATLDDFSDAMLDDLAARGFAWVWFLGIATSGMGRSSRRRGSTSTCPREE